MMKSVVKVATAAALAASTFLSPAFASSHREAPGITETPKLDSTDFYMFRSYEPGREGFVTIIANYIPLQHPYGGPNYFTMDPEAIYEIHVDNNGDAVEDLTFQFKFDNNLVNGRGVTLPIGTGSNVKTNAIPLRLAGPVSGPNGATQGEVENFSLKVIRGDRRSGTVADVTNATGGSTTFAKPLDNIGTKSIPNYDAYANQFIYSVNIPGCSTPGKVFVGQRAEAFAVNLGPVFDLVNFVPIQGGPGGFPGGITQDRANDDVVGEANVTSLALELPIACVTGTGNGVIGGWTSASLPQVNINNPTPSYEVPVTNTGAFVQKSRLSNPLVNELVIGIPDKDKFNASHPRDDGQFADYVTHPTLPALLNVLFRDAVNSTLGTNIADLAPANLPRTDLVTAFLTGFPGVNQLATVTPSEMIRLNTGVPVTPQATQNTLGVAAGDLAGFPNGRRPGDDTVDIALRVVMGVLCHDLPLGTNGAPANLGLCTSANAPVGNVAFTDGAPLSAMDVQNKFPYLNNPIPGASTGSL
jgi:Domain of unknown function (DUF4331)